MIERKLVVESGHFINVTDIALGPLPVLVSASADETLRLWDLDLACEAGVFRGHRGPVYRARLDDEGKILASGGWDQDVRIWDVESQETVRVLEPVLGSPVDELALSSDGTVVAATGHAAGDRHVVVWDVAQGGVIRAFVPPAGGGFSTALAIDAGGRTLVYADARDRLHVTDVATGVERYTFDVPPAEAPVDSNTVGLLSIPRAVKSVTVLADGRIVAVCWDGVRMLDLDGDIVSLAVEGRPWRAVQLLDGTIAVLGRHTEFWDVAASPPAKVHTIDVDALTISRDGSLLASRDGRYVGLYDATTAQQVRRLGSRLDVPEPAGNLARQFVLATSPAAPVVVHGAPDGYVRVWDIGTAVAPRSFRAHDATVHAVAVSPDGRLLATGGAEVKVWHAGSGSLSWSYRVDDGVKALAFSAEGSAVLVGGWSGSVRAFDASSGVVIAFETIDDRTVEGLGVSPWNDVMAVGFDRFRVWSPFLSTVAADLELGPAQDIAVSPTGTIAVPVGSGKVLDAAGRQPGGVGLIDRHLNTRPLMGHRTTPRTVAFSHDGARLASGGDDGELILWDVDSARLIARTEAHAGDVTGLGFLYDDRFVASIGLDGAVRIWDGELHLVATLISLDDDDYVTVTDDNYYSSTRQGLRAVKWRVGGRLAPFEEFDVEANRPDAVLERFGYAPDETVAIYRELHRRRVRRLGLEFAPVAARRGDLAVTGLPGPVVHEAASTVRVSAGEDGGTPLRLMVAVNDVLVDGRAGRELPAGGGLDVDIAWAAGDNELQMWSVDAAGTRSARLARRIVHPGSGTRPKLIVLAVGVSRYADDRLTLQYAAKDARDLAAELRRATDRFASIEVSALEDATRSQIDAARVFLRQSEVGDHVVVCFAGHGVLASDDFYFLPSDFDRHDLAGTALSFHELEQFFEGVPARRRLLLIDACHSGEADESDPATPPLAAGVREAWRQRDIGLEYATRSPLTPDRALLPRLQEVFADLREGAGAYVLAAAGANEYAFERDNLRNGVFTASVLRALRSRPPDGVTVSALARIVSEDVAALTGGRQRPVMRRENLLDDFVVA